VIEKIRRLEIVTEAVFYSADRDLLEQAKQKSLEGVYWAERDDNFTDKVKKIIDLTIRRVMDLPAMRGLAVTETADLDPVMNELILLGDKKASVEQSKRFRKKIVDKISESLKDKSKKFDDIIGNYSNDLTSLLADTRFMDSNKRCRFACDAAKLLTADEKCVSILKGYFDVLTQRNDLAHGHTEKDDHGIEMIKGNNKSYSIEDALQIRLSLLKHRDNLKKILENVKKNGELVSISTSARLFSWGRHTSPSF
jgi:hypothetical protein